MGSVPYIGIVVSCSISFVVLIVLFRKLLAAARKIPIIIPRINPDIIINIRLGLIGDSGASAVFIMRVLDIAEDSIIAVSALFSSK